MAEKGVEEQVLAMERLHNMNYWCPLINFDARYLRLSVLSVLTSTGKKEKAAMSFYDHCCKKCTFPGGIEPSTSA